MEALLARQLENSQLNQALEAKCVCLLINDPKLPLKDALMIAIKIGYSLA